MNRTELINLLCYRLKAKKYLEIGIDGASNFNNIECDNKIGVDPNPNCQKGILITTSDEFFSKNEEKFDVIFIDGLHHSDQVLRDITNAFKALNENGVVVCHDMNPSTEIMQRVPQEVDEWTGDCWKAWVKLRCSDPSLSMQVIDTDYGCGIIRRGHGILLEINKELTWDNLCKNRETWLNLVSVETFLTESL